MIAGSILGFVAVVMLLLSMPCINLGKEAQSSKNRRAMLGGVLVLIVGKNFVLFQPKHPPPTPHAVTLTSA